MRFPIAQAEEPSGGTVRYSRWIYLFNTISAVAAALIYILELPIVRLKTKVQQSLDSIELSRFAATRSYTYQRDSPQDVPFRKRLTSQLLDIPLRRRAKPKIANPSSSAKETLEDRSIRATLKKTSSQAAEEKSGSKSSAASSEFMGGKKVRKVKGIAVPTRLHATWWIIPISVGAVSLWITKRGWYPDHSFDLKGLDVITHAGPIWCGFHKMPSSYTSI
ncbi:hypothetical protein JOM56_003220 [Amanita muscaria]